MTTTTTIMQIILLQNKQQKVTLKKQIKRKMRKRKLRKLMLYLRAYQARRLSKKRVQVTVMMKFNKRRSKLPKSKRNNLSKRQI